MRAEHFFSEDERAAIAACIGEVEGTTSGELAVVVVEASETYPEGRILGGVVLGGLGSLVVTDLLFGGSLTVFLPLWVLLALGLGFALGLWPFAHRLFVPPKRLEQKVAERAVRAFHEHELAHTRDRSGVLFFFSLFERRVFLLADKGIYARLTQEILDTHARELAAAIKAGTAATTLLAELRSVGAVLAEHFPRRPDDTNELPDEVVVER